MLNYGDTFIQLLILYPSIQSVMRASHYSGTYDTLVARGRLYSQIKFVSGVLCLAARFRRQMRTERLA